MSVCPYISACPFLCACLYVCVCLFVSLYMSVCLSLRVSVCICLSVSKILSFSVSLLVSIDACLNFLLLLFVYFCLLFLSVYLSLCLMFIYVYLYFCLSVYNQTHGTAAASIGHAYRFTFGPMNLSRLADRRCYYSMHFIKHQPFQDHFNYFIHVPRCFSFSIISLSAQRINVFRTLIN